MRATNTTRGPVGLITAILALALTATLAIVRETFTVLLETFRLLTLAP